MNFLMQPMRPSMDYMLHFPGFNETWSTGPALNFNAHQDTASQLAEWRGLLKNIKFRLHFYRLILPQLRLRLHICHIVFITL